MKTVFGLDYTQEPPYDRLRRLFARGKNPVKSLEWVKAPKKVCMRACV